MRRSSTRAVVGPTRSLCRRRTVLPRPPALTASEPYDFGIPALCVNVCSLFLVHSFLHNQPFTFVCQSLPPVPAMSQIHPRDVAAHGGLARYSQVVGFSSTARRVQPFLHLYDRSRRSVLKLCDTATRIGASGDLARARPPCKHLIPVSGAVMFAPSPPPSVTASPRPSASALNSARARATLTAASTGCESGVPP
ncbi:hypothetical protein B0H16DRAFT_1605466, partial [Mycena metata]